MNLIRSLILHLIANSVALAMMDYVIPEICFVPAGLTACPTESYMAPVGGFLIAGVLIGLLNTLVKPILKLVSIPITFLSMGLFLFVINAGVLYLLQWVLQSMQISSIQLIVTDNSLVIFVYAAFLLSGFNLVSSWLLKR